jgi:HEAT repeat protein
MDTAGVERALGAIGTTFRLARLYPPMHPAVAEGMRLITAALPTLAQLGTMEWKISASGLRWEGKQLVSRNAQVAELAGLLYARGVRTIQVSPGLTAEHVLALFGVARGTLPPDDASLGGVILLLGRGSHQLTADRGGPGPASAAIPPPGRGAPAGGTSLDGPAWVRPASREPGPSAPPKLERPPAEMEGAVAALSAGMAPEQQRAAVETLIQLAPALVEQRDLARVAEAIAGLDRLLATTQDPAMLEAIDRAAAALTDQAMVQRMVTRLGEPRVPPGEREALVAAVGALAAVSVPLVIDAFLASPVDLRAPYRAAIRRAGDRALEPLQGRLADRKPEVAAVAAEFMGLAGSPQAVALLLPLLRHRSEVVREAALVGLAEAGGREISRPAMPALKDESVVVRAAAARAIGVGGEPASTTVLVRRLEQEADEGVQAEILRAIGRLGAREALNVLARYAEPGGALQRRTASVRAAAIEGIARLGLPEARAVLELYSRDKEPAVRKAAELALR